MFQQHFSQILIKEEGHNYLGKANSVEGLNYLLPQLYFSSENWNDANYSFFIRLECILRD